MPVKKVEKIWMNGKHINWDDAKVHVLSHVIHYGSSFFEGIRCYKTKQGAAVFRLSDHVKRLIHSARIFRAEIPFTYDEIFDAIIDTIKINELENCYIRPIAYRGYEDLNVNPLKNPVELTIAAYEWGSYLGQGAHESGIDVCVSSWRRSTPDTTPTMAKIGGAYMNSQLIKMEAIVNGFSEGIALDANGHIGEGSGENLFIIQDNILYTPGVHNGILSGITRKSIMTLAKEMGYEIKEGSLMREMLYMADEIFFCGTAAEITPIRSIDKMIVGNGMPGKVTKQIQEAFFEVVKEGNDKYGWLTFLDGKERIINMKQVK